MRTYKVKVKRFIPKGGINPNAMKPYLNMEDKLKEYFEEYDNRPPVVITEEGVDDSYTDPYFFIISDRRIVGYATAFDDTHIDIDFTNAHYKYLLESINKCRIDIVSMISTKKKDKNKDSIVVNSIIKLVIRKTGVSN